MTYIYVLEDGSIYRTMKEPSEKDLAYAADYGLLDILKISEKGEVHQWNGEWVELDELIEFEEV